jgi:hypothetical protein
MTSFKTYVRRVLALGPIDSRKKARQYRNLFFGFHADHKPKPLVSLAKAFPKP